MGALPAASSQLSDADSRPPITRSHSSIRFSLSGPPPPVTIRWRHEHDGDRSGSAPRTAKPAGDHRQREVSATRRHQRQHVEIIGPRASTDGLHPIAITESTSRFELPTQAESFANCLDHGDEIIWEQIENNPPMLELPRIGEQLVLSRASAELAGERRTSVTEQTPDQTEATLSDASSFTVWIGPQRTTSAQLPAAMRAEMAAERGNEVSRLRCRGLRHAGGRTEGPLPLCHLWRCRQDVLHVHGPNRNQRSSPTLCGSRDWSALAGHRQRG